MQEGQISRYRKISGFLGLYVRSGLKANGHEGIF